MLNSNIAQVPDPASCNQIFLNIGPPSSQSNCFEMIIPVRVSHQSLTSYTCGMTIRGELTASTGRITGATPLIDANGTQYTVDISSGGTSYSVTIPSSGLPIRLDHLSGFDLTVEGTPGEMITITVDDGDSDNRTTLDTDNDGDCDENDCDLTEQRGVFTFPEITCTNPNFEFLLDFDNAQSCASGGSNCESIPIILKGPANTTIFFDKLFYMIEVKDQYNNIDITFSTSLPVYSNGVIISEFDGNGSLLSITFDASGEHLLSMMEVSTTPANPPAGGIAVFTWLTARLEGPPNSGAGTPAFCCTPEKMVGGTLEISNGGNFPCEVIKDNLLVKLDAYDDVNCQYIFGVYSQLVTGDPVKHKIFMADFDLEVDLSGDYTVNVAATEDSSTDVCSPCLGNCIEVNGNTVSYNYCNPGGIFRDIRLFQIIIDGGLGCVEGINFTSAEINYMEEDPLPKEGICVPGIINYEGPVCSPEITGRITKYCGNPQRPMEGVTVCITESDCPGPGTAGGACSNTAGMNCLGRNTTTDASGFYGGAISCASDSQTLNAIPCKDCGTIPEVRCEINTLTLLTLRKHILRTAILTDPYLLIAADVNCDQSVSTLDIIGIQRLLLNVSNLECCWEFVPTSYTFPNPMDPWSPQYPSCVQNVSSSNPGDFVAIKKGDIDCLCEETTLIRDVISFSLPNNPVGPNQTIQIPFKANNFPALLALQSGIKFNTSKLQFSQVVPGNLPGMTSADNFGLEEINSGKINFVWFDENVSGVEIEDNQTLFILEFTTQAPISDWEDLVQLDDNILQSLAFDSNETPYGLNIEFGEGNDSERRNADNTKNDLSASSVKSMAVKFVPNPFKESTSLEILLPESEKVIIEIFDVKGTLIEYQEQKLEAGYNNIFIEKLQDATKGTYLFRVTSKGESTTGKLIKAH